MDKQVTVGGLLNETVAAVSASRGALMLYVLILGGISAAGVLLGLADTVTTSVGVGQMTLGNGAGTALFGFGSAVGSVIGGFLLAKAVIATQRTVEPGMTGFGSYFVMSILYGFGVMVGLILLVIPGIILIIRWVPSLGFLIGSDKGASVSLSASWAATKGHGIAIFLASAVVLIAATLFAGVPIGILTVLDESVAGIASGFFEAAAGAVFIVFCAATYFRVDESGDVYAATFE